MPSRSVAPWHGRLAVVLVAAPWLLAPAGGADRLTAPRAALPGPLVVTQIPARGAIPPARAEGLLREDLGEGGRIVLVQGDGPVRVLSAGFSSAADPEVSFDGERILFSGKLRPGDPWCIHEMRPDGGALRRITCGPGSARHPVYLPTMHTLTATATEPWDLVAFVGTRPGEVDEYGSGEARSLYACRRDGTALRRLTFNLSSDIDPAVLPDGRLVYASWQRATLARGPAGRFVLLAVNVDGTDPVPYAVDEGLRVKQMPSVTTGGLVAFVEADSLAGDGAGRLASVGLGRPLHSYRAITRAADGLFLAPSPLPGGDVLVSARPAEGGGDHALLRVVPATGAREPVFDEPGWHDVQARLLAPRPVPDGRASPVRDEEAIGKLYGLDVSIGDWPRGAIVRGTARRIRVLEGLPARAPSPQPLARRRLLGEAPVADDGSFHVLVPADLPVQLQLLDADGLALRSSAWIWTRGQFDQGCVGCHEDPEQAPPNRFVAALASPAADLTLAPELRRTVDFRHDVLPILEARCLDCHGAHGSAPDLSGTGAAAYDSLVPSHVRPGSARTSPLVWHLLGRNTSRPWDGEERARQVRPLPQGAPPLGADERRTIVEWIDTGAAWDAGSSPPRSR